MKEINTSLALSQLRMNSAIEQSANLGSQKTAVDAANFGDMLQKSIDKVNELQQQSGALGKSFELGDPNASLVEVMVAKQKADVAFQSVLQVRNKLLSAYKEIMAMQV